MSCCARVLLFCLGYVWIVRHSRPSPSHVAPIVVSNHVSIVDAFILSAEFVPVFVAKSDVLSLPILGVIVRALQVICVDRSDKDSRHKVAHEITRIAQSGAWPHVVIFPEGTTENGDALISFKVGPFVPGVTVQPMLLRYRYWFLDPSFTGIMEDYVSVVLLMCQVFNRLDVYYLPPYHPSAAEKADAKLFAENVRTAMAMYLGPDSVIPTTSHSFEDVKLQLEAAKLHLSVNDVAELEIAKDFPGLSERAGKEFLQRFSSIDQNRDGHIDVAEFRVLLESSTDPSIQDLARRPTLVEGIFEVLDGDQDNILNIRDFFMGMALLNIRDGLSVPVGEGDARLTSPSASEASIKANLMTAFGLLDLNHDGVISRNELMYAVRLVARRRGERADEGKVAEITNIVFQGCDTNGDGQIDLDEFAEYALKNPELMAAFAYAIKMSSSQTEDTQISIGIQ